MVSYVICQGYSNAFWIQFLFVSEVRDQGAENGGWNELFYILAGISGAGIILASFMEFRIDWSEYNADLKGGGRSDSCSSSTGAETGDNIDLEVKELPKSGKKVNRLKIN